MQKNPAYIFEKYEPDNNPWFFVIYFKYLAEDPTSTRVYPLGNPSIYYCNHNINVIGIKGFKAGWNIHGLLSIPYTMQMKKGGEFISIGYRPSYFFKMFGHNNNLWTNQIESLVKILPKDKFNQFKQIELQEDFKKTFSQVDELHLNLHFDKRTENSYVIRALDIILKQDGCVSTTDILAELKCSRSYLEKKFLQVIGMPLKSYSRLIRFKKCMKALATKSVTVADLVTDYNFYDTSHFYRDFKLFTGISYRSYGNIDRELIDAAYINA